MFKDKRHYVVWLLLVMLSASLYMFNNTLFIFFTSVVVILPLAYYLGMATEELAAHYSDLIGGLISSTMGNAAELIIGVMALKEGLGEVVKASITGSILGNTLFVFGSAVLVAGLKFKEQRLSSKLLNVNTTMLLITILLLLFPSLLTVFEEEAHSLPITEFVAAMMLFIYLASIIFSTITHRRWFINREKSHRASMTALQAFLLLAASVVLLTAVSERFVSVLEEIAHIWRLSDLFIGVVVVGLVGNVAEHIFAIQLALKNKMDLLLTSTVGSALQVALFVMPFLVGTSLLFNKPLILNFTPLEMVSLFASALLLNEVSKDGRVNWFEGLLLIVLYTVVALLFFFSG